MGCLHKWCNHLTQPPRAWHRINVAKLSISPAMRWKQKISSVWAIKRMIKAIKRENESSYKRKAFSPTPTPSERLQKENSVAELSRRKSKCRLDIRVGAFVHGKYAQHKRKRKWAFGHVVASTRPEKNSRRLQSYSSHRRKIEIEWFTSLSLKIRLLVCLGRMINSEALLGSTRLNHKGSCIEYKISLDQASPINRDEGVSHDMRGARVIV